MNRKNRIPFLTAIVVTLLTIVLFILHGQLDRKGFLNKKDIGWIGNEEFSIHELFTNIWFWDALLALMPILVVIIWIVNLAGPRSKLNE